jgi:hypothetical protein
VDWNRIIKENLQWRKLCTEIDLRSLNPKEGSEQETKLKQNQQVERLRSEYRWKDGDGRSCVKKVADGDTWLADGDTRLADGDTWLADGDMWLVDGDTVGRWRHEVGRWRHTVGRWRRTVGRWRQGW